MTALDYDEESRESTCGNNKMNDGWVPFSCFSFRVLVLLTLAPFNRTEPSLILTPARCLSGLR